jgi:5-methyltetrahydrofolate--homocysteine methyltransferase
MDARYEQLKEKVIYGDRDNAALLTKELLDAGEDAKKVIDEALIPAMDIVGEKFQSFDFFIPELLVAARAMEACLNIVKPILEAAGTQPVGVAVVGTVKGDLHDIGKNIVCAMLKGAGFKIIDIGVDADAAKFVNEAQKNNAQIICLSALLSTTMLAMKDTIAMLKAKGLYGKVKVMVGGAPLTQEFANKIGADGYSADATGAVKLARELISA